MARNVVLKRRLVLAALVVVSLGLLTVFFREPATGTLHSVQQDGLDVLSPVQSLATRAVEPFQDGYRWLEESLDAKSENESLRAELERLRGELVLMEETRRENEELSGLLDIRDAGIFPEGCTFVVARVIGRSPTKWQEWVLIDKGSLDGVSLNQAVVGATIPEDPSLSGKGLVGKVIAVGAHSAQVQLVTDSGSSVAAVVQGTGARGIVEGQVSGTLLMDFVERDQQVEPKRIVVTSGFGQIFPRGIPIGVVENVGEVDVNIYKQIEVRSFVDFRRLRQVMVVTNPAAEQTDVEDMLSLMPSAEGD